MIMVDEAVCRAAGDIAEVLGVRSLDAVHLACAQRLQVPGLTFLTFDLRPAQAARSLGFTVVGT
jgi:predicted nucleic acid-binding protein